MPRKPSVWFREQDGFYYTTYRRQQIKLAKDKKEAERAFHQLLADEEPQPVVRGRPTFERVMRAYLAHCEETCTPETVAVRRQYLESFHDFIKNKRLPDIRGEHVTKWLRANKWGKSTRSLAVQILKSAANRAVAEGMVAASPFTKVKKGGYNRRERIITPDEKQRIHERVAGTRYADFLYALEQTGCRPFSEMAKVTAAMVDFDAQTITFSEHKNAAKGKRRKIYLTPGLTELLRRLAARHPEGPLFRTEKGKPWDRCAANKWTRKFANQLGIKGVTTYSFRTTYITDCLAKGINVEVVAELCGTSPRMIWAHYNSIRHRPDALAEAARRAVS